MADMYTLASPVEYESKGEKKTKWCQCGVAFESQSGGGFNIYLDVLPINGRLYMSRKDNQERGGDSRGAGGNTRRDDEPPPYPDDDVPF